ncbi:MAG: hypothetical protein RR424_04500 [Oscillospiraceae bacterium]
MKKSSNGKIISILRKLGIASLLTKLDTHLAVGEQSEPIPARDAKGKAVHFCIELMQKWAAFVLALPKRFAA